MEQLKENNHLPSIWALPQDGNFWRIDWFGELAFPNRSIRRTQPSVLLHISRVVEPGFLDNPSVLLQATSTSPAKAQRKVWVSVGTLPLLRVGDIWQNGKLTLSPEYQTETFPETVIDERKVTLIKAGLNLDEKGFLLPLSEHPWHLNCTHSYCVLVDLPSGRRMVIPCVELIRFYFGSSGSLITKLCLPPLTREALYTKAEYEKASGRLVLELAERVSGASAADIGRLHLDKMAWQAALHVGTSALKASLASQQPYPQALFPFQGDTTLIASGKWLPFGDQKESTFVVFSLKSCSHPFPFKSLSYRVAGPQRPSHLSKPDHDTPKTLRAAAVNEPASQGLVEQDPSAKLAARTANVRFAPRFPDLTKKSVWKNKLLAEPGNAATAGTPGKAINQSAVGEAGSDQRVRSLELAVAIHESPERPPQPGFLMQTLSDLKAAEGITVELLTASYDDGWTIPMLPSCDQDGEIDSRLLVEDARGMLQLRRTALFLIKKRTDLVVGAVVDFEPAYTNIYFVMRNSLDVTVDILPQLTKDFLRQAGLKRSLAEVIACV